ncbi:hypothetical protein GW17_00046217 [Ensete ventricosum]|nr:hypothetical protein GW17_00046217 [Ensete ventricosum]
MEGQQDVNNTALIQSVRTLVNSKLGLISIGDRPPWNSIGVPPSIFYTRTENNIDLLMMNRAYYKAIYRLSKP